MYWLYTGAVLGVPALNILFRTLCSSVEVNASGECTPSEEIYIC